MSSSNNNNNNNNNNVTASNNDHTSNNESLSVVAIEEDATLTSLSQRQHYTAMLSHRLRAMEKKVVDMEKNHKKNFMDLDKIYDEKYKDLEKKYIADQAAQRELVEMLLAERAADRKMEKLRIDAQNLLCVTFTGIIKNLMGHIELNDLRANQARREERQERREERQEQERQEYMESAERKDVAHNQHITDLIGTVVETVTVALGGSRPGTLSATVRTADHRDECQDLEEADNNQENIASSPPPFPPAKALRSRVVKLNNGYTPLR